MDSEDAWRQIEREYWEQAIRKGGRAALEDYRKRYPAGTYQPLLVRRPGSDGKRA
jgi:hypothetical protein